MRMKILLLTQWFQPEPVFKGLPFAKALRDRGHEVEVLTGFPNYPGGKLYPGYRVRPWQSEVMEEIRVHRVALYPSHNKSALRRMVNYLSFGLSSATIGPFLVRRPDVVYVYNLVTLGLAALLLKLSWGCPVVYDIQDLWPDSVAGSGMLDHHFLLQTLNHCCQIVYRHASHLVTLSPGMKDELVRRGIPEERISVIYNWCDEAFLRPQERDPELAARLGLKDGFVVMFAGTMGVMQGLNAVLDAARLLLESHSEIMFVFVGGGVERNRLRQKAAERDLTNVMFLERQPPEVMGTILALADVLLVHLKDTPLFRITLPSKIQAYMASGKPVLLGVGGDAADIIHAAAAGEVVEPENPNAIAQGVLKLYGLSAAEREQMGHNAREYYQRFMSLKSGIRSFEGIFQQLGMSSQSLNECGHRHPPCSR